MTAALPVLPAVLGAEAEGRMGEVHLQPGQGRRRSSSDIARLESGCAPCGSVAGGRRPARTKTKSTLTLESRVTPGFARRVGVV